MATEYQAKKKKCEKFIHDMLRRRQAMIDYMDDNMPEEYMQDPVVVQNMEWLEEYSYIEIRGMEDAMRQFLRKKYDV